MSYLFAVTELGMPEGMIPDDIRAKARFRLRPASSKASEAELIEFCTGADAAFFTSRDTITAEVMIHSGVNIFLKFGGKPSNFDFAAANRLGIKTGWTPGANVRSVAEYAVFLAIAGLRRVPRSLRDFREGGWRSPEHLGFELAGRCVGLIGLGAIGQIAAKLFKGLEARVIAHDPFCPAMRFAELDVESVPIDVLFARSSVISLHCELTTETRQLIGPEALAAMKPDIVIVNTARGELIDPAALIAAISSGRLFAAGLDVYDIEPPPADYPLRDHPEIFATPHVAARTREAIERERFWAFYGAIDLLEGRIPQFVKLA